MKQYLKITGLTLGFVIFILISMTAYQKLSKNYSVNQLKEEISEVTTEEVENNTNTTQEDGDQEESTAPDFTVINIDDETIHLSDLIGKPILLNFWASWCPPCKSEMPDFQKMYELYGNEVQFVIVNMTDGSRETKESAVEYINENKFTFPVYFDTEQSAANAYSVSSIPTSYFIDQNGAVAAYSQGAMDEETLLKGIKMILPEE